jgi:hypothetical protein
MNALEFLFLINKGTQVGFALYDRINAGELTPEQALVEWKAQAVNLGEEEERFDRLMGDG